MIIGLGIDSVDIHRFTHWYQFSDKQLLKIFSVSEITYCLSNTQLSAQRFAVRFAAREAFFKAWNSTFPDTYIPFLTCCKSITLDRNASKAPIIQINWPALNHKTPLCTVLVSVTHTPTIATACILLQKISD